MHSTVLFRNVLLERVDFKAFVANVLFRQRYSCNPIVHAVLISVQLNSHFNPLLGERLQTKFYSET